MEPRYHAAVTPPQDAAHDAAHEVPSRARRVGLVLGPALFLALLAWPDLPLSPAQRRVAAVTAWTATWWITTAIPIGIASLLPAALLPLLGVVSARDVAPMYVNDLVLLFLGAFVVALGVERWGVHKRVAFGVIALVGTGRRRLVLGFMTASALLSLFLNNTSTTLMLLPIGLAVIASVEGPSEAKSPFAISLLLGMAYAASLGGTGTLIGTPPNQVLAGVLAELWPEAPPLDFATWAQAWLPLVALFVPIGWLLLTRVALRVPKEGERGAAAIAQERARLGPVTRGEVRMSIVFAITALLWITRAGFDLGAVRIPGWVELVAPASIERPERFVSDATVAVAMAIVCFLVPVRPGTRLMDWSTASRMPWEVLLLLGGGFAIAGSFQHSGLDRVLGEALGPWLAGRSDWVVVLAVVVFMAALTEVTSNVATSTVLLPVLGQAAVAADLSPLLTMFPATIAASAAFMLPVATPPNAVVFSSRLVPASTMARVGIWLNVAAALLITLVFQLWSRHVLDVASAVPDWVQR